MGSAFKNWQTNEKTFAVQNKNYLLNGLKKFADLYINQSHFIFPKGVADLSAYQQKSAANGMSQTANKLVDINNGFVRILAGSRYSDIMTDPQTDNENDYYASSPADSRCMDWEGIGNFSTGELCYILTKDKTEVRFVPKLVELNDYVNENKETYGEIFYRSNFLYKPSYTFNGGYNVVTDSPTNYNNIYVLAGIDFYYLNDGVFNTTGEYIDVYTPIRRFYTGYSEDLIQYQTNVFYPYLHSFLPYNSENQINAGFVLTTIFNNFYQFVMAKSQYSKTRFIYRGETTVGDLDEDLYYDIFRIDQQGFFATTKDNWTKIFNGAGLQWSYDPNVVADPNGDTNKPLYPGQPTNPTGGGGGTGDNISDEIPMPSPSFLPNTAAYNRYWLQPSKVSALQQFLLSDTFLNDIKRLWTDPAEYLIKLAYYPFDGQLHDYGGVSSATVAVAGIQSDIPALAMLDNYNCKFKGGSIEITEYYGTYLDYSPYTTAEIFIPYVGYKQINLSDVMGKTLEIEYAVDFDTGCITAFVLSGGTPMTMYSAPFGVELSISGTNANQVAQQVLGMIGDVATAAGGVISMVASGGATAPVELPKVGKAVTNIVGDVSNIDIQPRHFGTPSPTTSLFAPQQPFIVLHRPITAEPADFAALNGYSAGYSGKISSFSGYLKCSSVKLAADANITDNEQKEIISLFLGGVYIG